LNGGVLGLIEFLIFIYTLGYERGGKGMIFSLLKVLDSSLNQGRQQFKAKKKSSTLFSEVGCVPLLGNISLFCMYFWVFEIRQRGLACSLFIKDQRGGIGEEIKPRRVLERLLEFKKQDSLHC
jgi:hypothetical protein